MSFVDMVQGLIVLGIIGSCIICMLKYLENDSFSSFSDTCTGHFFFWLVFLSVCAFIKG